MEQFGRSWDLLKACFGVLRDDKELLLFPALSGLVSLAVIAVFAFVLDTRGGSKKDGEAEPEPFDPFAGGHPVPPLPGQELIVTRRAKATVTAAVTVPDDSSEPDAGAEGEEKPHE